MSLHPIYEGHPVIVRAAGVLASAREQRAELDKSYEVAKGRWKVGARDAVRAGESIPPEPPAPTRDEVGAADRRIRAAEQSYSDAQAEVAGEVESALWERQRAIADEVEAATLQLERLGGELSLIGQTAEAVDRGLGRSGVVPRHLTVLLGAPELVEHVQGNNGYLDHANVDLRGEPRKRVRSAERPVPTGGLIHQRGF